MEAAGWRLQGGKGPRENGGDRDLGTMEDSGRTGTQGG